MAKTSKSFNEPKTKMPVTGEINRSVSVGGVLQAPNTPELLVGAKNY